MKAPSLPNDDQRMPYWPAALNKKLAAAYCGISPEIFEKVCPVKPISFTGSTRGNRYLRQRLDEWLVSIDPNTNAPLQRRRFGDRINGGYGRNHSNSNPDPL